MNFELGNEMWKVSIDQHDPSVSESPTEIEEEPWFIDLYRSGDLPHVDLISRATKLRGQAKSTLLQNQELLEGTFRKSR